MTIQAFRIENFMAFEDTDWIELAPITLIFGPNSSGKSVFFRALRLLKQSILEGHAQTPFTFNAEDGVDLGSFFEITQGLDTVPYRRGPEQPEGILSRNVGFGFRCKLPDDIVRNLSAKSIDIGKKNELEFSFYYSWNDGPANSSGQVQLEAFYIELPNDNAVKAEQPRLLFEAIVDNTGDDPWKYISDFLYLHEAYISRNVWPFANPLIINGFLPKIVISNLAREYFNNNPSDDFDLIVALLDYLDLALKKFLFQIDHIPPIRPLPRSAFIIDEIQKRHWQRQGLGSYYSFLSGDLSSSEKQLLINSLRDLKLCTNIDVTVSKNLRAGTRLSEVTIDEGGNGMNAVNLLDIGFGTSQVLPLVLVSLFGEPGSVILVEQPELHLHPEVQARLVDFLVLQAKQRGIFIVLETHSEHILIRLQRRMAETNFVKLCAEQGYLDGMFPKRNDGPEVTKDDVLLPNSAPTLTGENCYDGPEVTKDDVLLLFVVRDSTKSEVEQIRMHESGEMNGTSVKFQEFFRRDYEDVVKMDQAIASTIRIREGL